MIFVVVGVEKYPFDRLIKHIDMLASDGLVEEEVFIQRGSSSYKPACCLYKDFLNFEEVNEKIRRSRITVTHGGVGSVLSVIFNGKVPIVVPRRKKYREDVDDHQVPFVRTLEKRGGIIAVYEVGELKAKIDGYDSIVGELYSGNHRVLSYEKRMNYLAKALDDVCYNLLKGNTRL
nr:hypothetical protein [Desulfobacterales bacterium]